MSESAEEMGSILQSAVEGPGDDPGDVPQSVSIDINPSPQADRDEVTGQIAALLAAHAAESKRLEDRVATLEALRLSETMAAAAASAAASAAAAAASAEAVAKVIETSEGAVQCAAEVLTATREVMQAFGSDGNIQSLLREHCVSAATSAKDAVLQALDDAREEALEFVEEQRTTVAAAGKRGGKKR